MSVSNRKELIFLTFYAIISIINIIITQNSIYGFKQFGRLGVPPPISYTNHFLVYSVFGILISIVCIFGIIYRKKYMRFIALGLIFSNWLYPIILQLKALIQTIQPTDSPVLTYQFLNINLISMFLLFVFIFIRKDLFDYSTQLKNKTLQGITNNGFIGFLLFNFLTAVNKNILYRWEFGIIFIAVTILFCSYYFFLELSGSLQKRWMILIEKYPKSIKISIIIFSIINVSLSSLLALFLFFFGTLYLVSPNQSGDSGISIGIVMTILFFIVVVPLWAHVLRIFIRKNKMVNYYLWLVFINILYLLVNVLYIIPYVYPNLRFH